MILLNGRRDDARDTNAITAHDHGLAAALFIQHRRIHGLGVLGPQLKNMTDLDTPANLQSALAAGTRIAADDLPNIGKLGIGDVAVPGSALDVVAVLIGATHEAGHFCRSVIHHNPDGGTHRAQ